MQLGVVSIELALVLGHAVADGLRLAIGPRALGCELLVELRSARDGALLRLGLDPLGLGLRPLADSGDVGLRALPEVLLPALGVRLQAADLLVRAGTKVADARVTGLLGNPAHRSDEVAHEFLAGRLRGGSRRLRLPVGGGRRRVGRLLRLRARCTGLGSGGLARCDRLGAAVGVCRRRGGLRRCVGFDSRHGVLAGGLLGLGRPRKPEAGSSLVGGHGWRATP